MVHVTLHFVSSLASQSHTGVIRQDEDRFGKDQTRPAKDNSTDVTEPGPNGQQINQVQIRYKSSDYASSFCRRKGWDPEQLLDQQWTILQANYVVYKAQIQDYGQNIEDDFCIK
jgi:hypothetical protein